MGDKADVWQGTLALMVLRTIDTMGPLHGYGIARRIEQTSGQLLSLNYGTLYPALLKLEQEGAIAADWGVSENNRKAKFYRLTRAGRGSCRRKRALGAGHGHPRPVPVVGGAHETPPRRGSRGSSVSRARRERALCRRARQPSADAHRRQPARRHVARRRTPAGAAGARRGRADAAGVARAQSTPLLEHLSQDVRFAVRQLVHSPGFTLTAVLTLALGIGAGAIFGLVDAALIRPLPYPNPDRLVDVTESTPQIPLANLSCPTISTGRGRTPSSPRSTSTTAGDTAADCERQRDGLRRAGERRVLSYARGQTGARSRLLSRRGSGRHAEHRDPELRRLAGALRRPRRHGRADAVTEWRAHTVVGVLPQSFQFAPRGRAEVWTPFHPAGNCDLRRSCHGLYGVAG